MDKEEPAIHPAVELLIARMQSHPEEFPLNSGHQRWSGPMGNIKTYGTDADREALMVAHNKCRMDQVHAEVMKVMLEGDKPVEVKIAPQPAYIPLPITQTTPALDQAKLQSELQRYLNNQTYNNLNNQLRGLKATW